jgi:hypothetical protein
VAFVPYRAVDSLSCFYEAAATDAGSKDAVILEEVLPAADEASATAGAMNIVPHWACY